MATSKSGGTQSAAAAKKTGPAARSSADMQDAFTQPLRDMAERMQNLQWSGAAGALLDSSRKDLQALVEANQKSYQGLQAVVQRQTEMMRSSIAEWQAAMQDMSPTNPQENLAKLDAMSKAAFRRALDDMRELSEMAARTQAEAFEAMRQRIEQNIEDAGKMLQGARK